MRAHLVSRESGAALLVFLLVIIVSASGLLLGKLNASIRYTVYNPATGASLEDARDGLMAWAVSHPLNPGTLPFPDRRETTTPNYDGYSDCTNGAVANTHLLGRLPWRGGASPCASPWTALGARYMDATGEALWYAVSKNLVYESPAYPFISPGLLGKSDGWITVRDRNGAILSSRVAFVLIAPGPALAPYGDCDGQAYAGQDRSGTAPTVDNYLDAVSIGGTTYSNADYDQDFIVYPNSLVTTASTTLERCDQFNDQLVFVTIDELMENVSKRVLNETANGLTAWHNANGALPWLAPFADPKSVPKALHGTATSAGSSLTDTAVDFTEWGVTAGDAVWNLSDGSRGVVAAGGVTANNLSLNPALRFGAGNTFSAGDEYYVEVRYMSSILMDSATGGSSGNTLEDSGRDFGMLGVTPGDIIENLSDGSQGVVSAVNAGEIVAAGLTGGTGNAFSTGDTYRIRTNTGRVTGTTANLILTDANVDFIEMGVQVGDVVHNLWDQTISRVTSIDSATQLTVDALKLGTGVVFNQNEPYQISRYNSRDNTRIGLLPIHQQGELIPTGFSMDWYSPSSGGSVTTSLATDATYTAKLRNWAEGSAGYSNTVTVPEAEAKCVWISAEIARCKGSYADTNADFLTGTATAGSAGTTLVDAITNFSVKLGVKRGDLLFDDANRAGIVSGLTGSNTINGVSITTNPASPALNFSTNNAYRIRSATKQKSGGTFSPFTFYNTTTKTFTITIGDASGVQPGDTIENLTQGGIGKIVGVSGNLITATQLIGGGFPDICPGPITGCSTNEQYRIHYDFVDSRVYEFDVTLKGTATDTSISGMRTRTVCSGYDAGCTASLNTATLKGDGTTAFVAIHDYEGVTEVGRATNILPVGGLASRSLKVSGMDFYLDDGYGDLPEWFIRNKWYQYLMVAYSSGESPGGTTCSPGTCLTLNLRDGGSTVVASRNDVRALVMISRETLPGQSWQDAAATDYFDDAGNTHLGDEVFDRRPGSGSFNDLIRIAVSCPLAPGQLCWSN